MIERGHSDKLGATVESGGVNFALYSANAEAVELVLFGAGGSPERAFRLPECSDGVWHGFVPGCRPGQVYGYRVHGPYAPERGLRFNDSKLLLDPYAKRIAGELQWRPEIFDYAKFEPMRGLIESRSDSAPFVPKGVVTAQPGSSGVPRPRIPWAETIVYEVNVRGYTMRHPAVDTADGGTFRGMRHRDVLAYLKSLGITAVELMPVHAFVDEEFLVAHGLRNFWGYNTLGFFAPAPRLLGGGEPAEFREMVDAIHDTGLEVVLDVVYNHTAEGGRLGPTLSLRGIDNPSYYRLLDDDLSEHVNDTGTGNTIDTEQPAARQLILDSLRYWAGEMGVDGFRFDLATVLGRRSDGFDAAHPLFAQIERDPLLGRVKLIAEPWDVGPGGYRLGGFPKIWAEWNDRFRDAVRRFWRADAGLAPEFARRVHGSADIFEAGGRGPVASVNFVTSHDGFTLRDCVSYADKHNEANGEGNRDGHADNFSCNHGVEGETDDPDVLAARRRHRLAMLSTLLLSQGTPMLLGGDELGNGQGGNNNAYAQDNERGWIDWSGLEADPAFVAAVRRLIELRRRLPLVRQPVYLHDSEGRNGTPAAIRWFGPDGAQMSDHDWSVARAFGLYLRRTDGGGRGAVVLLFNASAEDVDFALPDPPATLHWRLELVSTEPGRPEEQQPAAQAEAQQPAEEAEPKRPTELAEPTERTECAGSSGSSGSAERAERDRPTARDLPNAAAAAAASGRFNAPALGVVCLSAVDSSPAAAAAERYQA